MMEKFFETLFADKPPKDHILIWEKYNKSSSWFTDIEKAIDFIRENANHDIYVGCGTSPKSFGSKGRCKAEQIAGIPGLWLDLDVKDPAHKKKTLPATEADVQAVLSCFPLPPTLDIHSGHGRQLWWAFKEFWTFESTEERLQAANLMHRFNIMFRENSKKLGFELDMTFDLARIMRIPGTTNHKAEPAMPVLLLKCTNTKYAVNDIEELVPKMTLPAVLLPEMAVPAVLSPGQAAKARGQEFILNPIADPHPGKFYALCNAEPLFEASWNMKRKFRGGKDSASEYDLSLANFAFQAGWSWQEVADLLMAFRRTHSLKPKTVVEGDPSTPLREDYYIRTLKLAQTDAVQFKAQENVDDYANEIGVIRKLPLDQQPDAIKANLTDILRFPCDRLVMQMTTPPDIRMETSRGNIQIGEPKNLIDQRKFREHVANLQIYFKPIDKKKWENVAAALLAACEQEFMGEESTLAAIARGWLRQYLAVRQVCYDVDEAFRTGYPGIKGDMFFLFGPSLRDWLLTWHKEKISAKEMGLKLRALGLQPTIIYVKAGTTGRRTSREVWGISASAPILEEFVDMEEVKAAAESNAAEATTSHI